MADQATREQLGHVAHEAWATWADEQPKPWPIPKTTWEDRHPGAQESFRRIGEAVAAFAAEHCAQAILAHMEAHGPKQPGSAWRRHLSTAARVAAGAFMTREDMLAGAVEAIQRGDFVVCSSLQNENDREDT